ncbi:MAG: CC0125/CC1285 family lipoprotein [Candidatus Rhabdochlamydia sp.]
MKCIKFTTFSILTAAFLLLSGCATSYKALGFNGGYSEIRKTPDSFMVTFTGNGYTSQEKVMQYALRRASELTLQNGYKYFSVISSTDQTKSHNYSTTNRNTSGSLHTQNYLNSNNAILNGYDSSSTYSGTITAPKLLLEIQCFNEKISPNVIDAAYFLQNNV